MLYELSYQSLHNTVHSSLYWVVTTVEPQFKEPLFNEVLNITNNILCPGQSYSKIYGIEPQYNEPQYNRFFDIMNIVQKPKCKIYLDVMNYNVNTRQKININCCWFLFSSIYHFLFKFFCTECNLHVEKLKCFDCKCFWQRYRY